MTAKDRMRCIKQMGGVIMVDVKTPEDTAKDAGVDSRQVPMAASKQKRKDKEDIAEGEW